MKKILMVWRYIAFLLAIIPLDDASARVLSHQKNINQEKEAVTQALQSLNKFANYAHIAYVNKTKGVSTPNIPKDYQLKIGRGVTFNEPLLAKRFMDFYNSMPTINNYPELQEKIADLDEARTILDDIGRNRAFFQVIKEKIFVLVNPKAPSTNLYVTNLTADGRILLNAKKTSKFSKVLSSMKPKKPEFLKNRSSKKKFSDTRPSRKIGKKSMPHDAP